MSDVLALATLIGVSAAVIGVFAAVLQLRELSKQRRRDFENLFVQRYWKIMDDLSLEAIECTTPDGGVVSSSDKKAVIAFLTLSEDELDLRSPADGSARTPANFGGLECHLDWIGLSRHRHASDGPGRVADR